MKRTSIARNSVRTAVVAGMIAGVGLGLAGLPAALAAPGDTVIPFDPGRVTYVAPTLPTIADPTLPPFTVIPTFTLPPKTLTTLPTTSTSSSTPTTPSSTTAPSTTTDKPRPTTTQHTPQPTPSPVQPHPYPKGAPETGSGDDGGLPLAALGVLALGLGGFIGSGIVLVRRRTGGAGR